MSIYSLPPNLISYYTHFLGVQKRQGNCKRLKVDVDLDLLNVGQRKAYTMVEKALESHTAHHMIIHGLAGVGKSYVLNAVRSLLESKLKPGQVMVVAPTGIASAHISGCTIHSLFKIPIDFQTVNYDDEWIERELQKYLVDGERSEKQIKQLEEIKQSKLELKQKLRKLSWLLIDEGSMLSLQLLGYIEQELKESLNSCNPFGNINVVVFMDLGQLGPVGGTPLFGTPPPGDLLALNGWKAYKEFNTVVVLDEPVRQMGNEQTEFRNLLLNVRNGTVTDHDIELLNSRVLKNLSSEERNNFMDAMHLYPYNIDVHRHNQQELEKLNTPMVKVLLEKPNGVNEPEYTMLGIKARVVLLQNLWVQAALVNGARGTIETIVYNEDDKEPDIPAFVTVSFDDYRGGTLPNTTAIPIKPMHLLSRALKKLPPCKEIPLKLFYASSIHKAQSQTISKLVVDFKRTWKPAHCLVYTALSRCRKLTDLALITPLSLKQLEAEHDVMLKNMLAEEARLRILAQ